MIPHDNLLRARVPGGTYDLHGRSILRPQYCSTPPPFVASLHSRETETPATSENTGYQHAEMRSSRERHRESAARHLPASPSGSLGPRVDQPPCAGIIAARTSLGSLGGDDLPGGLSAATRPALRPCSCGCWLAWTIVGFFGSAAAAVAALAPPAAAAPAPAAVRLAPVLRQLWR